MSNTFNQFQINELNKKGDFQECITIHDDPKNQDTIKQYKLIATGVHNHWGRKYVALESSVEITEKLKRELNLMM